MPRGARPPGAVRRHCLALHQRLKDEVDAKRFGHIPRVWRDGRLVVRTPAKAKP